MSYSVAKTEDAIGTQTTTCEVGITPTKAAESVVDKSLENSETISNLSNAIYLVTAIILAITIIAFLISIAAPFVIHHENQEIKKRLEVTEERMHHELAFMKAKAIVEIKTEFAARLLKTLNGKIDTQMEYHNTMVEWQVREQSIEHEGCLYYVEKVHEDLLRNYPLNEQSTPNDLYRWIIGVQKDYSMLLQLVFSGKRKDEKEKESSVYSALGTFEGRTELPDSFVELLRFLKEHKRLSGENLILAKKMVKQKFNEDL